LVIDVAKIRVPLDWDPSSNVFVAIAAPTGGVLNYPVLAQGDPGVTPDIDSTINFTPLTWDDPAPDSASFTETSPNLYRLNLSLHNGTPGDDGDTVLDPGDFAGAAPGKIIALNSAATAFELQTPKVGERAFPSTYNSTPTGNPSYTLCSVGIAAQNFDWRPECFGSCKVTGTASDVRVDLFARLGTTGIATPETAGNIVGRAIGGTGVTPATHTLIPALPEGVSGNHDRVLAGNTATVYFRAERVAGTGTFSTSNTDTTFWVKVNPIP
jgi:hypothetical protein